MNNDCVNTIALIIMSLMPFILLLFFLLLLLIFNSESTAKSLLDWAYWLGYMSIAHVFIWVADGFLVYSYLLIKREFKESPPQYMVQEQKDKDDRKKSEKQINDIEKYHRYITIVGKGFFVKYYCEIRDLLSADLLDVIQENYPFEEKLSRINNAKKIFEYGLEHFTLEQISNTPKQNLNNIIILRATELLKSEFND